MPPRHFRQPPPKTDAAVAAQKAFFCELCGKQYAREKEYSSHLLSYDHQHRERMKGLKDMNKVMGASTAKARRNEEKDSGLVKMDTNISKEGSSASRTGFKKGTFKSTFTRAETEPEVSTEAEVESKVQEAREDRDEQMDVVDILLNWHESDEEEEMEGYNDTDDEGYEHYDPTEPTDCHSNCPCRQFAED